MITTTTTYAAAKKNLATLLARVSGGTEVVIIKRRNSQGVAMISAAELSGLVESIYLLRSPANGQRLLSALADVQRDVNS